MNVIPTKHLIRILELSEKEYISREDFQSIFHDWSDEGKKGEKEKIIITKKNNGRINYLLRSMMLKGFNERERPDIRTISYDFAVPKDSYRLFPEKVHERIAQEFAGDIIRDRGLYKITRRDAGECAEIFSVSFQVVRRGPDDR